jgi:hypothetical protein
MMRKTTAHEVNPPKHPPSYMKTPPVKRIGFMPWYVTCPTARRGVCLKSGAKNQSRQSLRMSNPAGCCLFSKQPVKSIVIR